MRNFGRVLLLVVGGLMLAFSITVLIKDINAIKELVNKYKETVPSIKDLSGIKALFEMLKSDVTNPESKALLINMGLQIFTIIASISAILSAISNHGGFWFSIFSIILLALFISDMVAKSKAGAFAPANLKSTLLQIFKDAGLQIGYIAGFLLLKFTHKK